MFILSLLFIEAILLKNVKKYFIGKKDVKGSGLFIQWGRVQTFEFPENLILTTRGYLL